MTLALVLVALATWLAVPAHPRITRPKATRGRLFAVPVVLGCAWWLRPEMAPLALVAAAAVWAGSLLRRRRLHRRRAEQVAAAVSECCDVVAAELAAGQPPAFALRAAVASWPGLRVVADTAELGGDVPASLRAAAQAPGASALELLAGAWVVSLRTGAGLADAAAQVARSVGQDQALARLVAGELASARATAKLMAVLPVLALLMGSGAGGDPWDFLLGTPWGTACLAGGLALTFAGLWWIEAIADGAAR